MFSIIIPLYNKATYLEKAVRSVLNQSCRDFELIVVNDGSTDNSLEVAKRLQADVFDFQIIDQANAGVSTARNNGVKNAKYPYICLLDADDWWEPTFLEEMKKLIGAFPEAGIYGSSYYIIKNQRKRLAPIGVDSEFERGYINYCQIYSRTLCMPLWTGAVVIPKNIYNQVNGFVPKLKLGEDFHLWVRIASKYPVAFLNKPLAYYNQDVELAGRAVSDRLYEVHEHMLFADYGVLMQNHDFRFLYERLALYGLLPYYLVSKNEKEVKTILSSVNWSQHEKKYRFYYLYLPKWLVRLWFAFLRLGSKIKTILKRIC